MLALGCAPLLPPREIAVQLPVNLLAGTIGGCVSVGSLTLLVVLCRSAEVYSHRQGKLPPKPSFAAIQEPVPRPTKRTYTPAMKYLLPKAIVPKAVLKSKIKNPQTRSRVMHLPGKYGPVGVYADECCSKSMVEKLRDLGVTADHAHELGHWAWGDEKHLDYAARHGLLIITHDRDFLRLHADGETRAWILHGPGGRAHEQEFIRLVLELIR